MAVEFTLSKSQSENDPRWLVNGQPIEQNYINRFLYDYIQEEEFPIMPIRVKASYDFNGDYTIELRDFYDQLVDVERTPLARFFVETLLLSARRQLYTLLETDMSTSWSDSD